MAILNIEGGSRSTDTSSDDPVNLSIQGSNVAPEVAQLTNLPGPTANSPSHGDTVSDTGSQTNDGPLHGRDDGPGNQSGFGAVAIIVGIIAVAVAVFGGGS